jgi:hypothetical protein
MLDDLVRKQFWSSQVALSVPKLTGWRRIRAGLNAICAISFIKQSIHMNGACQFTSYHVQGKPRRRALTQREIRNGNWCLPFAAKEIDHVEPV